VYDEIGAFGDHLEVVVRDEGGDLDDGVACGIEPGHLEIHPCEHDTGCYRRLSLAREPRQ